MKRIVDVSQTGRHLARKHGFMTISENGIEIGRIALDEIQALIVHAHGVTYSNSIGYTNLYNNSLDLVV